MKAIRYHTYGPPDVLELADVETPSVGDTDVLVRVRAASINPLDYHYMRGAPYIARAEFGLRRPKVDGLGADFAGTVEAVGKNVTGLAPGDEVYGSDRRTLAEYVKLRQDAAVLAKPASLTFEQAAAVPVAAFTALQALRDKGHVQPGQKVLVNGAAGGVGTFTIQIAKALGAEVTGVCSSRNVEMVGSIGADKVIDYSTEDFTRTGRRYDLLVDIAGNRKLADCRRVLAPKGTLVNVGGPNEGKWIGPAGRLVTMALVGPFVSQTLAPFLAHDSRDDLAVLSEMIEAGKVTPVIDRTYPLSEAADALRYLEAGHARGKVVITVQSA